MKTHKIEHVLFDCECQVELHRGTLEEIDECLDTLPGGSYQVYPCPDGYEIIKVEGRTEEHSLRITIESTENK